MHWRVESARRYASWLFLILKMWQPSFYRAMAVLAAASPCALAIGTRTAVEVFCTSGVPRVITPTGAASRWPLLARERKPYTQPKSIGRDPKHGGSDVQLILPCQDRNRRFSWLKATTFVLMLLPAVRSAYLFGIVIGIFFWLIVWRVLARYGLGANAKALTLLALAAGLAAALLEAGFLWSRRGFDVLETVGYNLTLAILDAGYPPAWQVLAFGLLVALGARRPRSSAPQAPSPAARHVG
jgi:hypothetical protein